MLVPVSEWCLAAEEPHTPLHNALRGVPIAVRIRQVAAPRVFLPVLEKSPCFNQNPLWIRAHQPTRPRRYPLRPLGRLAHYQDRFAKARGLFLDAPGVTKDEIRPAHQPHERLV